MTGQDYHASLSVPATPAEVFDAINDVGKWWTDDLEGNSGKQGDEFTVHFSDVHVSTQKVIELIPGKKVTWLVTRSNLSFIKDKAEWTNTKIVFNILSQQGDTVLNFTHYGLVPAIECFKDCSKGWDYYFKGSLFKLLTEGTGTPGL